MNRVNPRATGFESVSGPGEALNLGHFPITTDDVVGSGGVLTALFNDIVFGSAVDDCSVTSMAPFHGFRQVTGRDAQPAVNAAFNERQFWDGRARDRFNGVDGSGALGPRLVRIVLGFPVTTEEIIERYVGLNYERMMADIGERHGRAVPDSLRAQVEAAALARIERELEAVPGMHDLLAQLEAPRAIASSSDLARIALSLQVAGLERFFDPAMICSVDMVTRPKPAPDVFLLAAERGGTDPARCIVVEDSPHGVEAACAAGMTALGLLAAGHARPSLGERLRKAGAREFFEDCAALGRYLGAVTEVA